MAITTRSNKSADVTSRSVPKEKNGKKFNRIETVTSNTISHFTGSRAGSSGFIIKTAGQGVISATGGGSINASVLNTKELYEIGVREISGSCTVHVIF